jgi:hypothetical protein
MRFLLALVLLTTSLCAGQVDVYSYDPSKLIGTRYANDFRRAREGGEPVYVSVDKARRLIKQCKAAVVNKQTFSVTEQNNFLNVSRSGRLTLTAMGGDMMMASSGPQGVTLNLSSDSGAVYRIPASRANPNGLFLLAYQYGNQMD